MLTNLKGYFRPTRIPEALALLEKNSGSILVIAGGTKLVLSENNTVQELVDITSLELSYIKVENNVARIGATTTLQKIIESPDLKDSPNSILSQAALLTQYSRMMRNVSTIGGELISTNSFSVLYCALMVLQAQVRIAGGEEFALAINIFLNKKPPGGGLLIEILIPRVTSPTFSAISALVTDAELPPIQAVCARVSLEQGVCKNVKLAITGTQRVPKRLHYSESKMEGQRFTESTIESIADCAYERYKPVSDSMASEEFRKETSRLLVKKALTKCFEDAAATL
ncbi:FAD binding domain-containing protein [bacterium]|nr:FAD binding domain-containing protein [bacterium]